MILIRFPKVALMAGMALLVIGLPVLADELRGTVKSVDANNSRMVVHDELAQRDVVVNFNRLTKLKSSDRSLSTLKDLKPGAHVSIMDSLTASKVTVEETSVVAAEKEESQSILAELACPPKPGPVLMGIVQLAESQGAIHAKTTQTGPDRGYPPRLPSRSRRRLEHQPCLPQGRDRTHHLLPLEGPPGGPRIE